MFTTFITLLITNFWKLIRILNPWSATLQYSIRYLLLQVLGKTYASPLQVSLIFFKLEAETYIKCDEKKEFARVYILQNSGENIFATCPNQTEAQKDKTTDKQTNKQINRQPDNLADRQTDNQAGIQTNRQTERQTYRQMDRQTEDKRTGIGQANVQASGQSNGQTNVQINRQANGQAIGHANMQTNGQANGQANGRANSQTNWQANIQINGQANRQANGQASRQSNDIQNVHLMMEKKQPLKMLTHGKQFSFCICIMVRFYSEFHCTTNHWNLRRK